MKVGFKKIVNTFLMLFIFTFAVNCAEEKKKEENNNKEIEKTPDSLITNVDPEKRKFNETQEEYQTRLAGVNKVKKRTTINYLYDLKGNLIPKGAVSEIIEYDNKGRRAVHIAYRSMMEINYKWEFKHDTNNNMTEFTSFDNFNRAQLKKTLTYDSGNKLIGTKEIYPATGNEVIYSYKYDDKGNLIETVGKTSEGKETSEKREYYEFGKVKKAELIDKKEGKTLEQNFHYDVKGNLIKEVMTYPNKREQVISYSDYFYIYPKEIQSPGRKKVFEYDENGNATLDIMFNSDGGRQYKFVNEFDKNGLVIKKTRYDALDKPALIIEYEYEYYK